MGNRNAFNVKLQENFHDSAIMVRFKIAVLIYHDLEVIVYPLVFLLITKVIGKTQCQIEKETASQNFFKRVANFENSMRVAFLQIILMNDLAYNEFSALHLSLSST